MRLRIIATFASAFLFLTPAVSLSQLSSYGQDFEGMVQTSSAALSSNGWVVYGNVFTPGGTYLYGYGTYPAPNSSAAGVPSAFSAVAAGEGGPTQGSQQLSVFSDYENGDHANGNLVESIVFQERTIAAGDVGTTWYFEFDAKRGLIVSPTTAVAFIKTLDPGAGYATTNLIQAHMTYAPVEWRRYGVSITIDASLAGQLLQFGFASTTTNYAGSSVFYDNVQFTQTASLGAQDPANGPGVQLSVLGNPAVGNAAQVLSFTIPRDTRVTVRVYDIGGRLVNTLIDRELGAGVHQATWQGQDATGRPAAPGIYFSEVVAGTERAFAKLLRAR